MIRVLFLFLSILIGNVEHLAAVILTHYGYEQPGQADYDPQSAAGQGAFGFDTTPGSLQNINASGVTAAALSPDVVQQYNLQPGQEFTVTTASGEQFNLVYADNTASYLTGRIDLYDPSDTFQGSGAQVSSVNGGAIIESGNSGVGGSTGIAAANATVETINIAVVDELLGKFKQAGQSWVAPLTKGATTVFWLLALISLVWTGTIMVLKQADLAEIMVELTRYIMTIGIFYWLLTNGPTFAAAIISSLRQLGGEASGTGQSVFPGDLITLGVQVIQSQMKPINWLFPVTSAIPVLLSVIVLIVCILTCANIVLLLIAGWIVAFAGVVVLGFGASRWTSDIAINYFRTALGIGLSLMTMQLVISIGISFLQQLVQTNASGDIGQLLALTVAVILLAVIAHKLPQMVSGMVTGSGHNGGIGAIGLMSAIGAAMAASSIARSAAGGAAGAAAMSAADKLRERMSVLDGSESSGNGSGNGNGNGSTHTSRMGSSVPSSTTMPASQPSAPSAAQTTTASVTTTEPEPDEPTPSRPIAPDVSRGYSQSPPEDWLYPDEPS